MEQRVNSLETEITLLKSQMGSCQDGLYKEIEYLKRRRPDLPQWIKNAAALALIGVFSQTITTVWWASSISTNVENITKDVAKNTEFRMSFPKMHEEVMVKLGKIEVQSAIMDARLQDVLLEHREIVSP